MMALTHTITFDDPTEIARDATGKLYACGTATQLVLED